MTYQSSSVGATRPVDTCQNLTMESCVIGGLYPGSSYTVNVTAKATANSQTSASATITVITSKLAVYVFLCVGKYV